MIPFSSLGRNPCWRSPGSSSESSIRGCIGERVIPSAATLESSSPASFPFPKVAFTCNIGSPSVTLVGDTFQPSGLLTGGSRRVPSCMPTCNSLFVITPLNVWTFNEEYSGNSGAEIGSKLSTLICAGGSNGDIGIFVLCLTTSSTL
ncbi:hypothetical protein J5N97_010159 [Dioscorea zingiberensis]|uniref:Uncharacterized protein n=1 Tax=Dioscorea zingiberensis TaxID=325984 RepID=A0A9D5HMA3_9LILI|nr:hypothetical protein J5N97_010159 [Dioscorea zingiberensis]